MSADQIKIKLRSFDYKLLDSATREIVGTIKRSGAVMRGPIPIPRSVRIYTVNRSPHVNKKSREQFAIKIYSRLIVICYATPQAVDSLMSIDLAAGVDVNIKLIKE